jgi:uncharacterized protein (TIGR00369 family)
MTAPDDDRRPRTDDEIARLNEFVAPTFDGLYGLRYTALNLDSVTAEVDITPKLHQPFGLVHGGVYCAIAEAMASVAAGNWFRAQEYGKGGLCVGVNNNTDFFQSAREGVLYAEGRPLHRGRLQQLWEIVMTNADGRLMAKGQVRIQNLPPRPKSD